MATQRVRGCPECLFESTESPSGVLPFSCRKCGNDISREPVKRASKARLGLSLSQNEAAELLREVDDDQQQLQDISIQPHNSNDTSEVQDWATSAAAAAAAVIPMDVKEPSVALRDVPTPGDTPDTAQGVRAYGALYESAESLGIEFLARASARDLRAFQDHLSELGTSGAPVSQEDLKEAATYQKEVLSLRLRGAEWLDKGTVDLENPALVQELEAYSTARENSSFDTKLCVEMEILLSVWKKYSEWLSQHSRSLSVLVSGRSRTRSARDSGELQTKRLSYKDFAHLFQVAEADFSGFTSPALARLRAIPQSIEYLNERASALLERMHAEHGKAGARPSSKLLNKLSYDFSDLLREAETKPVVHPSVEEVEQWANVLEWRRRASQTLISSRFRASFADSTAESLTYVPPAQLDVEELETLMQQAKALEIPGSGTDSDSLAGDVEEEILMSRLVSLLDSCSEVLKTVNQVYDTVKSHATFSKSPLVELIEHLEAKYETQANSDNKASTIGVVMPQISALPHAVQLLDWYHDTARKFQGLEEELANSLKLPTTPGQLNQPAQLVLSKLQGVISEAQGSGVFPSEKVRIKARSASSRKNDALKQLALDQLEFVRDLWSSIQTFTSNAEAQLAADVEQWRRGLVGMFIEVEWDNKWYPAKIIVYNNLAKDHGIYYQSEEVESVIFHGEGVASSPDGDPISFRKCSPFKITQAKLDQALEKFYIEQQQSDEEDKHSTKGIEANVPQNEGPDQDKGDSSKAQDEVKPGLKKTPKRFTKSVVGSNLKIEWNPGQFFLGKVVSFDTEKKLHTVMYKGNAIEQMLLNEDGTAVSASGDDTFRWVSTQEDLVLDASEEEYENDSTLESDDDEDIDEDDFIDKLDKNWRPAAKSLTDGTGTKNRQRKTEKEKTTTIKQHGSRKIVRQHSSKPKKTKKTKPAKKKTAQELRMEEMARWTAKREAVTVLFRRLFESAKKELFAGEPIPSDTTSIAKDLEKNIEKFSVRDQYASKVRQIKQGLAKNEALFKKVLLGKVTTAEICMMSADQLAGESYEDQRRSDLLKFSSANIINSGSGNEPTVAESALSGPSKGKPNVKAKEKVHLIDKRLAETAQERAKHVAERAAELVADQSRTSSPKEQGPSLSSLLSLNVVNSDDDDEPGETSGTKKTASKKRTKGEEGEGENGKPTKNPKLARQDLQQYIEWTGTFRTPKSSDTSVCLRLIDGAVLCGAGMGREKALSPCSILGMIGAQGAQLSVNHRTATEKASKFFNDVLRANKEIILTSIHGKQGESGLEIQEYIEELEAADRVGVIDQGKSKLLTYLVPRGLKRWLDMFKNFALPEDALGFACIIVSPKYMDKDLLGKMRRCTPLDIPWKQAEQPHPAPPANYDAGYMAQEAPMHQRYGDAVQPPRPPTRGYDQYAHPPASQQRGEHSVHHNSYHHSHHHQGGSGYHYGGPPPYGARPPPLDRYDAPTYESQRPTPPSASLHSHSNPTFNSKPGSGTNSYHGETSTEKQAASAPKQVVGGLAVDSAALKNLLDSLKKRG